jgi:hypothetical protein
MYHKVVRKCIQSEPVHCFCALLYIICALYYVSFAHFLLNPSVSQTIFYLGQAWWRKIQVLGLSPQYKEDNIEVGKWIKRCFGLHFPKPFDVEDSFTEDIMVHSLSHEYCTFAGNI